MTLAGNQNIPLRRNAWQRLLKNKTAVSGMIVIGICCLLAVFAYFVAPDRSPNANTMVLEIGGLKPGGRMQFIKVPTGEPPTRTSLIKRLVGGSRENFVYVPIVWHQWRADSVIVNRYIDESLAERVAYATGIFEGHAEDHIITRTFILGTDKFGRDILSRLLIGVRVSLGVGLVTVLLSVVIGLVLGAIAGYYRGWIDEIVMWFVNVMWSIPTVLLVFAITLALGKGFWQIFVAVGLTMWVNVARIVRGQVIAMRELEYVEAARALGYSPARIIARHIIPNLLGPVAVVSAANFASAIVIEAGLSFLGIGVQPPQPSWGLMIRENYNFIITQNPALALVPGFAIMMLVLAFNMLGNGLRDALQVKD